MVEDTLTKKNERTCREEMLKLLQIGTTIKLVADFEDVYGIEIGNIDQFWKVWKVDILNRLNHLKEYCINNDLVDKRDVENLIEPLVYLKIEQINIYGQKIIDIFYSIIVKCQGKNIQCRTSVLDLYMIGSKLVFIGEIKALELNDIKYNMIQDALEKLNEVNKNCIRYYNEKELQELLEDEIYHLVNIIGSLDIEKSTEYGVTIVNTMDELLLDCA